jgi:hypothetical protein
MTAVTVGENAGDVDGVLKLLILESWSRSERVPRVNPRSPTVGTCQRYLPSIILLFTYLNIQTMQEAG